MSDEENKQETNQETATEASAATDTLSDFSNDSSGALTTMGEADKGSFSAIYDVPVNVSAVLGRTSMPVSQLLKLSRGAVIELDRKVGESIDIYVNNRLVARGEVVVVEDHLGITMTEIIKTDQAA